MNKKIKFLKSNSFGNKKISYGFFTRNGGKSKKPFNTLNCSRKNGDSLLNVRNNIKLAMKSLKLEKNKLIIGNQIHSKKVIIINDLNKKINLNVDGYVTQNKNVALGILTADCAPIFFYDPIRNLIGAAHSGWKGCLKNISNSIIKSMESLGSRAKDIQVIIGPCINQKNYEVDKRIFFKFFQSNKKYKKFFKKINSNKFKFNITQILRFQLDSLGVRKISLKNEDTYSNVKKYYSHRRSNHLGEIKSGRMINIIGFFD